MIPPAPTHYVVDEAGVLDRSTFESLDRQLEKFEQESSNQIVVAIYPKMLSESSIEDYTVRVAQTWGVGQKSHNNGVVLFVFTQDRKMYIQVGYGLEGALPDLLSNQIIRNEITPFFKQGNYSAGISAGVNAILLATKGEYKGTEKPVRKKRHSNISWLEVFIWGVVILVFIFSHTRRRYASSGIWMGGGSSGSSGGSSFGGGGGSFGGGGSGGSW